MCDAGPSSSMPPRHLEAGQPRHLHIEEHQVGLQAVDGLERLDAVAGLADHLDPADLSEQIPQLVARELLIVHENGPQIHVRLTGIGSCRSRGAVPAPISSGISSRAQVPCPGTLVSFRLAAARRRSSAAARSRCSGRCRRRSACSSRSSRHAQPIVEHLDDGVAVAQRRVLIVIRPPPTLRARPCLIEFSTSGWRIMLGR